MWSGWMQRLSRPAQRGDVANPALLRVEVCPPERLYRRSAWQDGFREGLREWLNTGWQVSTSAAPLRELRRPTPQDSPVLLVRKEFADTIADIRSAEGSALTHSITQARSLRELWHLRIEVYTLVARSLDELQAQTRLARLNRHFPTRAPKSSFSTFGGL